MLNKLRILHLGKYFFPFQGGIENVMHALMLKQYSNSHSVSAVVHHHQTDRVFSFQLDNDMPIYQMPIQRVILFVPIALMAIKYLRKAIKKQKPDILHLHMPNIACFWLLFLSSAQRIPWVVHWHSDVVGEKPDWRIKLLYPLYGLFEQWLLKRAARIIVTSPNYLNTSRPLQRWHHKCDMVPLAIDINKKALSGKLDSEDLQETAIGEIPHSNSNVSKCFQIICIGRLTYYKGHQYLIDAIKLAIDSNVQCHLDIVGDGELEEELKLRVSRLNLDQSITFHGKLRPPKLEQLFCDTDVLCLSSIERTEGFGLVLLEAMQQHKPCIVTDVPGSGMSYVVEHNKTGMVVQRESAKALYEAIVLLAGNLQRAKAMGEAGYQRVTEHFSLDTINHKVDEIYQVILAATH